MAKLEAAELRIGLADDEKLGKLLDVALPNILGFLAVSSAAVKTKTMAILSHVNKRVKSNVAIKLPLAALAKLFTAPATAPLVANFALIYVELGLPRVAAAERSALIPNLIVGISTRPAAQQDTLLGLLLSALPSLTLPKTKTDVASTLPFLSAAADRAIVLRWALDLLLYMPPMASSPHVPAPGLSRAAAKRVCGKLNDAEVRGELRRSSRPCTLYPLPSGTSLPLPPVPPSLALPGTRRAPRS